MFKIFSLRGRLKLNVLGLLSSVLLLMSCANAQLEKEVNQKLTQETEIKSLNDLRADATFHIENAKGVSADQKAKLFALRDSTRQQIDQNWQQSLKLKSLIISDLVEANYNESEVERAKTKLKGLESKRLSIMFDALEEANKILGRQAQLNTDIMHEFIKIQHD